MNLITLEGDKSNLEAEIVIQEKLIDIAVVDCKQNLRVNVTLNPAQFVALSDAFNLTKKQVKNSDDFKSNFVAFSINATDVAEDNFKPYEKIY